MVNAIGIGFSRTGSTWLSRCLAGHPDICFSKEKETHFFNLDTRFAEGINAYHSYFECKGEKVVAEFTAVYAREPEKVAERIHAYNPKAKLIVMLRNPADRAFSNYIYRKSRVGGYESFEKAVEEKDQIIQEGFYAKHLEPFFRLFPIEQFIFVVQEEGRKNPKEVIQKVYGQLGVNSEFSPSCIGKEVNASKDHVYKLSWLQHLIQRTRMMVHKSKLLGPVRNLAKLLGITKVISQMQKANEAKGEAVEEMLENTRAELMECYKEDIRALEQKTGLNLQVWKR